MTRLDREARVAIEVLRSRGTSNAAVARLLGVTEGTVRYHAGRMSAGALDGRGAKAFKATRFEDAITHWPAAQGDSAINLAALHAWLMDEHSYDGSLRSVQRFWAKNHPAPTIRARRHLRAAPALILAGAREWVTPIEQGNVRIVRFEERIRKTSCRVNSQIYPSLDTGALRHRGSPRVQAAAAPGSGPCSRAPVVAGALRRSQAVAGSVET